MVNFNCEHDYEIESDEIADGTQVKLNYDEIASQPDYGRKTGEYRDWINENKDTIFTVHNYEDNKGFIQLVKEGELQKWIFLPVDLIVIEDNICQK